MNGWNKRVGYSGGDDAGVLDKRGLNFGFGRLNASDGVANECQCSCGLPLKNDGACVQRAPGRNLFTYLFIVRDYLSGLSCYIVLLILIPVIPPPNLPNIAPPEQRQYPSHMQSLSSNTIGALSTPRLFRAARSARARRSLLLGGCAWWVGGGGWGRGSAMFVGGGVWEGGGCGWKLWGSGEGGASWGLERGVVEAEGGKVR
jgi:hypothetical protein